MTRAIMIESKVSKFFSPEAVATSIYLINRLPTKILNMKITHDSLSKQAKIPGHLNHQSKVFGCTVYTHIPKHERTKLSPCATKCVFVGYGVNQKGYRCYDPSTRKITTTMNYNFLEIEFFYHTHLSSQEESGPNNFEDYLSWVVPLPSSSTGDSTDLVVVTATKQVSPQEPSHPPLTDPPPTISEIILEPNVVESPVITDLVDTEP